MTFLSKMVIFLLIFKNVFMKKVFTQNRVILVVYSVRNLFLLVPWLYKNQFFQHWDFSWRCQKETFLRNIDVLKFFRKILFAETVILKIKMRNPFFMVQRLYDKPFISEFGLHSADQSIVSETSIFLKNVSFWHLHEKSKFWKNGFL